MKTAISLPNPIFEEAESLAKHLGLSRSELYTEALKAYLQKYSREQRLTTLNQVYAEKSPKPDPVLTQMQWISLPREDW
jgi:metal-responsive CopG/Arc/MetJ family transcriptional regulator